MILSWYNKTCTRNTTTTTTTITFSTTTTTTFTSTSPTATSPTATTTTAAAINKIIYKYASDVVVQAVIISLSLPQSLCLCVYVYLSVCLPTKFFVLVIGNPPSAAMNRNLNVKEITAARCPWHHDNYDSNNENEIKHKAHESHMYIR